MRCSAFSIVFAAEVRVVVVGTAAVTVIPVLTGCCCTGFLFGIWAMLVLMRPEVKAGFAARRRAARSPDGY